MFDSDYIWNFQEKIIFTGHNNTFPNYVMQGTRDH